MDIFTALCGDGSLGKIYRVGKAIDEGTVDKLSPSDVELFVVDILAPLRHRIDEILAQPKNAKILELKPVFPSQEELLTADLNAYSKEQKYQLIAQAAAYHSHRHCPYEAVEKLAAQVGLIYEESLPLAKTFAEYAKTPPNERRSIYVHSLIAVGIVAWDGKKEFRLKGLMEATSLARAYLASPSRDDHRRQDVEKELVINIDADGG